jgi:hypothetical protein
MNRSVRRELAVVLGIRGTNLQHNLIAFLIAFLLGTSDCSAGNQSESANRSRKVTTIPLTDGWFVVRPDRGPTAGKLATVRSADGTQMLQYRVQHDGEEALLRPVPVAGFNKLSLKIWSQEKTLAAISLEDRDKAKFHALMPLEANHWTSLTLIPTDFTLNDDSPVKKAALDPQLLGPAFALIELGKMSGLKKPNVLRLASLQVEYGEAPPSGSLALPAIIDGTVFNIIRSGSITQPITVRHGGKLVIKAPSVHLAADINLDHGSIVVDGGTFVVDSKFPHQFHFAVAHESSLAFEGCKFTTPFMIQLDMVDNSKLEIKQTEFLSGNGFTCNPDKSTIVLEDVVKPGEFVIEKGSHFKVTGCHGVLLWLRLGPSQKIDLTLPPSNKIGHFAMPPESKLDLSVNESDWIFWALITEPGADVTIRNSNLMGSGMAFPLNTPIKIANLKNNTPSQSLHLNLPDRKLSFFDSTVKAWNFYPCQYSHLEIEDSTFGEMNSSDIAQVAIRNSVCDGSGGYIRVSDKSKAEIVNCTLNCPVVTANNGQLTLDHCKINGTTTASDDSLITLRGSTVNGQRQQLGRGRIRVEP